MRLAREKKVASPVQEDENYVEEMLQLLLQKKRVAEERFAQMAEEQRKYLDGLEDAIVRVRNFPAPAAGQGHPLFQTPGPWHPSEIEGSKSAEAAVLRDGVENYEKRIAGQNASVGNDKGPKRPSKFVPGSNTYKVIECIDKLVADLARPIGKQEVIENLTSSGGEFSVAEPLSFVQKALWKSGRYRYIEASDAWWPMDRDIPPI